MHLAESQCVVGPSQVLLVHQFVQLHGKSFGKMNGLQVDEKNSCLRSCEMEQQHLNFHAMWMLETPPCRSDELLMSIPTSFDQMSPRSHVEGFLCEIKQHKLGEHHKDRTSPHEPATTAR